MSLIPRRESSLVPLTLYAVAAGAATLAVLVSCSSSGTRLANEPAHALPGTAAALRPVSDDIRDPREGGPDAAAADKDAEPPARPPAPDLTLPGTVVRGTTAARTIDTRTFPKQIQRDEAMGLGGVDRRIREIVPAHDKLPAPPEGEPNALLAGPTLEEPRTIPQRLFPSIDSTGWTPPDPCLAVGPNHVLVTVNQDIGWFTKTGVAQFQSNLGSPGSPGFFEDLGAENFCFDPKCFFDHYTQRFVVLALETYRSTEAWITIAVSDDADPNGVWHKYRTDAVLAVGTTTTWWDFPGLGYDQQAYYVTGNLFGLNASGGFGVGVRVFDKAPLLVGDPAVYSTQRLTGVFTVMPAIHLGGVNPPAGFGGYMATVRNSTSVRVYAIQNPLSTATIVSTDVTVPSYTGAIDAPTQNGTAVSNAGFTMPSWRNGRMALVHNASVNGRNLARWHEFNVGTWPAAGGVTRVQSGDIDGGPYQHTIFPAIVSNAAGDLGVSLGTTGEISRVAAAIAGRRAADPTGRMGVPVVTKPGERDQGGRWGDYYAIAVDPVDDTTFWAIGEYALAGGGWQNWVSNFRVADQSLCHPVPDDAGVFQIGVSAPVTIDVLANDWHSTGAAMTISAFDAVGTLGGTVVRSVGTGPGGRDRLIYAPPATPVQGTETFSYTVSDGAGNSAAAAVTARVFNPGSYRVAETPSSTRAGLNVAYYDLAPGATALPTFAPLTPASYGVVPSVNFASSNGNFATSGRADNIGAVFEAYFEAPTTDLYTFFLTSDDGSKMYLGESAGGGLGTLIINNDGSHGMVEKGSGFIGLQAGKHKLRIEYFDGGGAGGLIAAVQSSTIPKAAIAASRWSSTRPCPAPLVARVNNAAKSVTLTWPAKGFDPPPVTLRRDGVVIATGLPSTGASAQFVDLPPMPAPGPAAENRHVSFVYEIASEGAAPVCAAMPLRVVVSGGVVAFEETFDDYADAAALASAGWQAINTATATEPEAIWTLANGSATGRPNLVTVDGTSVPLPPPVRGRYIISDSDVSSGTNPRGTGASHDLITPVFSCAALDAVYLHFDATAQLNNDGSGVFDIDVSTNGGTNWTNVARRVAPGRTSPAPAVTISNADGQFGRATVNLSGVATGQASVMVRFRHFEPTNDWYIGLDNIVVDSAPASSGGAVTILANENFVTGVPATWQRRGLRTGNQTWTTADPCARSVTANGGVLPRNSGRAVNRLGSQFAIADGLCTGAAAMDEYLITPAINCSGMERVYLHVRSEFIPTNLSRAEILVSLDGGATFLPLPLFNYSAPALRAVGEEPFYDVKVLHVPEAAGRANVAFAFHYVSPGSGSQWWAVDDVRVTGDPLPPECTADFNADGELNPDDLGDYINCYFAIPPCAGADFNADGDVNPDDLGDYINAYFAGCV